MAEWWGRQSTGMEMTARSRAQNNKGGKRRGVTWRIEKGKKGDSCGQCSSVAEQWLWAQQSGVLCLTHPLFEGTPQCPEPPLGSALRYGHKDWPPPCPAYQRAANSPSQSTRLLTSPVLDPGENSHWSQASGWRLKIASPWFLEMV